jgi:enoyl-CoA hydratase/carnithine racemase
MSAELISYSVTGAIAEITLDRAPVNALSMPLIDALLGALAKARDDEIHRALTPNS